jgi:hypothetical protein
MRTLQWTLPVLLLAGLAVACQRSEEEEFADLGDTTVVAVPDTAAEVAGEEIEDAGPGTDRPEREVVVIREERAPARTERRTAPEPEPAPEPEAPREAPRRATATVPAGTNFFVTTETALSTQSNQVGDPVAARTAENINVNGQVVIPAGALVEGHVTAMKSAGNPGEVAYIDLSFDRVRLANGEWQPIQGVLAGKAGEEVKGSSNTPRNVAIGAGAGAVLGRVIGGDTKGAVIGAVIGAGAGAAAGQATRDTYVVVPSGSRLNVQLTSAVSVPTR